MLKKDSSRSQGIGINERRKKILARVFTEQNPVLVLNYRQAGSSLTQVYKMLNKSRITRLFFFFLLIQFKGLKISGLKWK